MISTFLLFITPHNFLHLGHGFNRIRFEYKPILVKSDFTLLGQWDFSEEGSSSDMPSQNRGHDNVHDDMNMYVIMHDH